MSWSALGQLVRKHEGDDWDCSDEELGQAYFNSQAKNAFEDSPHWFLKWRTEHLRNQTGFILERATQASTIAAGIYTARHTLDNLPKRLEHAEAEHDLRHELVTKQGDNALNVIRHADAMNVDTPTYLAIRQKEETNKLEYEQALKLSDLKVTENRRLETNRLKAYQKEVTTDLRAALSQRLMPHETVLGVLERLQKLIELRASIEKLDLPEPNKNNMLIEQDKVIAGFQEDLRVQMERHLLKGGNQKELGATDQADDSPSGY